MRFGYGAFRFERGEASLRGYTVTPTRGQSGFVEKVTCTLDIDFEIIRDTQAAITARFNQISAAIRRDGRDAGFYQDDGSPSAIFLDSSRSSSGVGITQYPSAQPDDGADYATHLKGSCGFFCEFLPGAWGAGFGGGGQGDLASYSETLSVRGTGGPRWAVDVTDRGPPGRWKLCDETPIYARQSGAIEVVFNRPFYPEPNLPYWPQLLVPETAEHVKSLQQSSDGFRMQVAWNYEFESDGPLFGVPQVR